ncbi:MAG: hypothetical protein V3V54_03120, partial [Candidatus Brocadiales bacterium]
ELEFAAGDDISSVSGRYDFSVDGGKENKQLGPIIVDWRPVIRGILEDLNGRVDIGVISARFHNILSGMIVEVARRVGEDRVVLSGGCFQNRYLLERTVQELEKEGFRVYTHQRVPPNDGGISLGQVAVAGHILTGDR